MRNNIPLLAFLLCLGMAFLLFACSDSSRDNPDDPYIGKCPGDVIDPGEPVVFAQDNNLAEIGLDVIFRDFPVDHPGFEEFDVAANPRQCAGTDGNNNAHTSSRDQICVSGDRYIYCDEGGTPLMYGQDTCEENENTKRGYTNGPDKTISNQCWHNPVYVTRGMVQLRLDYSKCSGEERGAAGTIDEAIKGRYCARPVPAEGSRCYGSELSSWFTSGGAAKDIYDVITLDRVLNSAIYKIEHDYNKKVNWNGNGPDNGYFPLDKYDGDPNNQNYGKQSMNLWCWQTDASTPSDPNNCNEKDKYCLPDECKSWLNGSSARNQARNTGWASDYVNNRGGNKAKWHNYGFTMAGSGEFKFKRDNNDKFEFISSDDMWIFIDGELVADLGGTHLAAPAKVFINEIADARGWQDDETHVINFFYADRQTNGSNIKLEIALNDLKPPIFGAPRIMKADTEITDGKGTTFIWVNSELDLEHIKQFVGRDAFPIIVHKGNPAVVGNGPVHGYKLESIEYIASTTDGYAYKITGFVCVNGNCREILTLNTDDYLSFNVLNTQLDGLGFKNSMVGLDSEDQYIRNKEQLKANNPSWSRNVGCRFMRVD